LRPFPGAIKQDGCGFEQIGSQQPVTPSAIFSRSGRPHQIDFAVESARDRRPLSRLIGTAMDHR
jgi:hypothetical protein